MNLYEPVHGSAPDIAGTGKANPLGAILTAAMVLRHSAGLEQEAAAVENAVRRVLEEGHRTADITRERGTDFTTTEAMGRFVHEALSQDLGRKGSMHAV